MNKDKKEIRNNHSYKLEDSIYKKVEKLLKKNTGLCVSAFIRMTLIEYLNKNKDENEKK